MKITDIMSITELSRLTNKSRPTIYKYLWDYENGKTEEIPFSVLELFNEMENGMAKKDVYDYCARNFVPITYNEQCKKVIEMILNNSEKINFDKLEKFLTKEIGNGN